MIAISLAYLVSFTARLFFKGGSLTFATAVAATIIMVILFFFVFEMKKVENKLRSNSFQDHLKRHRRLQKERIALYSVYIVLGVVPLWTYQIWETFGWQKSEQSVKVLDIVLAVRACASFSCHFYMHA